MNRSLVFPAAIATFVLAMFVIHQVVAPYIVHRWGMAGVAVVVTLILFLAARLDRL